MIISITGPSGIGKGYIVRGLTSQHPNIKELIWITTRNLRVDQQDDCNRRHVSLEEFRLLEKQRKLIFVQELLGNYYALRSADICDSSEQVYITEFHIDNLEKALDLGSQVISIGLIPSSISFLRKRLKLYRGTEDDHEIDKRIESAKIEIERIRERTLLFSKVIEISESTENNILSCVLEFLQIILKGDRNEY